MAALTGLSLVSCGDSSRTKLEHARVKSILIYSRAYATEHNGKYPGALADLHPKYIDLVSNFYSPPQSETENQPQPYYYRPGLKVGSKIDEPLVVSPHVVKGMVNVGYLGGFIRQLEFEEVQKLLSQPGWVQKAPPLGGRPVSG